MAHKGALRPGLARAPYNAYPSSFQTLVVIKLHRVQGDAVLKLPRHRTSELIFAQYESFQVHEISERVRQCAEEQIIPKRKVPERSASAQL